MTTDRLGMAPESRAEGPLPPPATAQKPGQKKTGGVFSLYLKAHMDVPTDLQIIKARRCSAAIKEADFKALLVELKTKKAIDFIPFLRALEGLKEDPNYPKYVEWARPVLLALAAKQDEQEMLYSLLLELHHDGRNLTAEIDSALNLLKDSEKSSAHSNAEEVRSLVVLGETIHKRDLPFVEGAYRHALKQKIDPESLIRKAVELHPLLGEADLQFARLFCKPQELLIEELAKALQSGYEPFLKMIEILAPRSDLFECAKKALALHPDKKESYFRALLHIADPEQLFRLFYETRKAGIDPHLLIDGIEEKCRLARLFDAISKQDIQRLRACYRAPEDFENAKRAILHQFVHTPEESCHWLEQAQVALGLIDKETAIPLDPIPKDPEAFRGLISKVLAEKDDPRLIYAKVAPHLDEDAKLTLWKEIEIAILERAIERGDFATCQYSMAVFVDNPRVTSALELFRQALKRLKAKEPDAAHLQFFEKVLDAIQKLTSIIQQQELENAHLNLFELYRISVFAISKLSKPSAFYKKGETGLEASIQVDSTKQSFYIALKKASAKKAEGTSKSLSRAPGVVFENHVAKPAKAVRLVNKRTTTISPQELSYLLRYAREHVHTITAYPSDRPGKPAVEKTSLIMEEFEHDLEQFISGQKLSDSQITSVLLQLVHLLELLHRDGVIYGDIKTLNVLMNALPLLILVSDFGGAYEAIRQFSSEKSYGTPNYTSLERLQGLKELSEMKRLEQGMRDDMFALGCLLYELLHQKRIPWGASARRYYFKGDSKYKERALALYESELPLLQKEHDTCTDPVRKRLLFCCLGLLDRNPAKRMQKSELLSHLTEGT